MRKMILMRGVSGSGKSTLARQLARQHPESVIYSTDDFFMVDGEYRFEVGQLSRNHYKNWLRTVDALKAQIPLIIIDNTHTQAWEMMKYASSAKQYGYEIEICQPDPVSLDELMRRQEERGQRGKHVARDIVEKQLKRFEHDVTVEHLLTMDPCHATV